MVILHNKFLSSFDPQLINILLNILAFFVNWFYAIFKYIEY